MTIRENLLKFSFATGDSWRDLYLDAKEKLGSHHLCQIIRIHWRTGISYFGCGIPVLSSWMCEDLARAWSQSRLS